MALQRFRPARLVIYFDRIGTYDDCDGNTLFLAMRADKRFAYVALRDRGTDTPWGVNAPAVRGARDPHPGARYEVEVFCPDTMTYDDAIKQIHEAMMDVGFAVHGLPIPLEVRQKYPLPPIAVMRSGFAGADA